MYGSPGAYMVRLGGEFPNPVLVRLWELRKMNPAEFHPDVRVTAAVRLSKIPSALESTGGSALAVSKKNSPVRPEVAVGMSVAAPVPFREKFPPPTYL